MAWVAKITGDMTLSVLDAAGFKVLGVDMLRMNTMRAGDGGQLLARTLNDLHLLAAAASYPDRESLPLAYPSEGASPRPWKLVFHQGTRRLQLRDAQRRLVGERTFPKRTEPEKLAAVLDTMRKAVHRVNQLQLEAD